eukprot:152993-Prymnesium_polylepis.1
MSPLTRRSARLNRITALHPGESGLPEALRMLVLCAFSSKALCALAVTCTLWRNLVTTAVARILQERHYVPASSAADPAPAWPWEMISTNGQGLKTNVGATNIHIWQSDSWTWPEHGWPKGKSALKAKDFLPIDQPCAWKLHIAESQWHFQVGLAAYSWPRASAMLNLGLAEIDTLTSSIPVDVGSGEGREELLERGGDLFMLFWK